jgi:hypothetical protein
MYVRTHQCFEQFVFLFQHSIQNSWAFVHKTKEEEGQTQLNETCEISGSHSGEYEVQSLLGYAASETWIDICLTTWQYIPEDSELLNGTYFLYALK